MQKAKLVLPISTSSVQTLRDCEQKYVYAYVQNISPKAPNLPMKKGAWFALLLAAHYKWKAPRQAGENVPSWEDAHAMLTKKFLELPEAVKVEKKYANLPEVCEQMMRAYLWHYEVLHKNEGYEDFKVVATEQKFEFDVNLVGVPITVRVGATVDRVGIDSSGNYFIMEDKTGKEFPYNYDTLMFDPQVTLQMKAFEVKTKIPVKYTVYNYIRSSAPKPPAINQDGKLSKTGSSTTLQEFVKEINRRHTDPNPKIVKTELDDPQYEDLVNELRDPKRSKFFKRVMVIRNDVIAQKTAVWTAQAALRTKRLREHPESADRAVGYRCKGCQYSKLCFAEIQGHNTEFIRSEEYEPREDDRDWLNKHDQDEGED